MWAFERSSAPGRFSRSARLEATERVKHPPAIAARGRSERLICRHRREFGPRWVKINTFSGGKRAGSATLAVPSPRAMLEEVYGTRARTPRIEQPDGTRRTLDARRRKQPRARVSRGGRAPPVHRSR